MAMGGRQRKIKGNEFERLVAGILAAVFPQAQRGIGQARFSAEVSDVDSTPFWIECKHHKRVNVRAAMKQAKLAEMLWRVNKTRTVDAGCATCMLDRPCHKHPDARARRRPPLVIYRDNNEPIMALLLLDDLLPLLEKAFGVQAPRPSPSAAPQDAP